MELIILFGSPGAGKGTQSALLAKNLGYLHRSTGELIRKEISDKTELGKKVESLVASGNLVSDDLILGMVKNFFQLIKNKKGLILDGFPRTIGQAQVLSKLHQDFGIDKVRVINLQADEKELTKRLLKRAKTEGRKDDTKEAIMNRLKVYNRETHPLLDYYSSQGVLINISGMGPIDKIQEDILNTLRNKKVTKA